MGLYLAVFEEDDELDGVEVGSYADFGIFRDEVTAKLEGGKTGALFPTLIIHSDCDGEWTPSQAALLEKELTTIRTEFQKLPPIPLNSDWQKKTVKLLNIQLNNLNDCFFDIDGEPLIERLLGLTRLSQERNLPILFQ